MNADHAPLVLNLGCGTRTSTQTVNIDWSIYQRLQRLPGGKVVGLFALRGERLARFRSMRGDVVVHDLRKGIPADTGTVDAVYHSHVLEHIARGDVPSFFGEIRRVLRTGGTHRIVVPDLERHIREYLSSLDAGRAGHDEAVGSVIEQLVRREAYGTSRQRPLRRRVENLLLGSADRRGETHRWMWDRLNLAQALELAGFTDVRQVDAHTSSIPGWDAIGLDVTNDGAVYKPGSLFMEATRPRA